MSRPPISDREKAARQKSLMNGLAIFGAISFLGSTTYGMAGIIQQGMEPPPAVTTQDPVASKNAELLARARGYELVLQREPNNTTALEGLAIAKIELGDAQGAIAPLERLVELNPENPEYKAALDQVRIGATQPTGSPPSSPPSSPATTPEASPQTTPPASP
ncbi:MAG: tetratricopeptide repeat protein [Coleofasciculaceae cyanobacterium SM2_1_6]|nr:tetratricopeptide repeat protein [Coleofasciculaceae cyanobacterium SM2_1_6]